MSSLIGQTLGRYHILEQLGEGGMATVYLANDENLNRKVALKLIRIDKSSNQSYFARFGREAKVLAKLSHQNIVHINAYGEHDGIPYLIMDHISGGTLKQRLGKAMPIAEAATLLAPIARALEYAHTNNVIHRDVKPANILLTETSQPMLTDFGIAKILELDETLELTATGIGMGTPDYMAPEQWTGKAEALSDQYALGVVFFEMITGHRPFTADTPAAILLRHVNEPVPQPRKIIHSIPAYVESIIFKVLAKRPEDRFANMGEFASILEKLAAGQAVKVTPFSRKALASTQKIGGMALIGILFLAGITFAFFGKGWVNAMSKESSATKTPLNLTTPLLVSPTSTMELTATITPTLSYPLLQGSTIPKLETISDSNSDQISELARWGNGQVNDLVISPDKQGVYVGTNIGLFEYSTKELHETRFIEGENIHSLAYSVDGKELAFIEGSRIVIQDTATNSELAVHDSNEVVRLQYLPNGKLYAISLPAGENIHSLQITNLSDKGDPINIDLGRNSYVAGEITPDGSAVIVSQTSGTITLYDLIELRKIQTYIGHKRDITTFNVSPDQNLMASGDDDGTVYIWNFKSGQPIHILSNTTGVSYVKITPDNKKVLVALYNGSIQVWDVKTGKNEMSYSGHVSLVTVLAFSQDGALLISGAADGEVIIWDVPSGKRLADVPGNSVGITSLAISPDGTIIATVSNDNNVILWNRNDGQRIKTLAQTANTIMSSPVCGNCGLYGVETLNFSPDGYSLAAGYTGNYGTVWDINSEKPTRELKGSAIAFCPNQPFIATGSNQAVHLYDLNMETEISQISGKTCAVSAVACSADGTLLAYRGTQLGCGGLPDTAIVMKLDGMVDLFAFAGLDHSYTSSSALTFSPDGKILATGAEDGIKLWDTQSGTEIPGPVISGDSDRSLADFSPDGSLLAFISDYNHVSLFDVKNNKILKTLEVLTSEFRALKFASDGSILVTGHSDGTIRVWGIKP